jgi:predicted TPR repeat methyltransferase
MPNVYTFKDFEGSSHRVLIELIGRHATGGTLLDLGAAGGELGSAVRGRFQRTIGFEYNVDCAGELKGRFDQIVIADLDRVTHLPSNVDAIVLADVLEHLRNPAAALRLVRAALKDDGHAFISVPNIANITMRLGLLLGIFEYRERGILDRTHLRFYTARTFRREVENAGFRILETHGTSIPVRLVIGRFTPDAILRVLERMLVWTTRLWRSLFAYQIVVVAVKK